MCVEKIVLLRVKHIAFSRPGSDLLSRVLRRSTIGAGAFHGRVRNENGCGHPAITTRSAKGNVMRSWLKHSASFVFYEHVFCCSVTAKGRKPRARRRRFGAPSAAPLAREDKTDGLSSSDRTNASRLP